MTPLVLVDTNVVLRLLLADHAEQHAEARALFERAESGECSLGLDAVSIAEAVWVMTSVYKRDRLGVSKALIGFIQNPAVLLEEPEGRVVVYALERFGATKLDYIDCYLAARATILEVPLVLFGRGLKKASGVKVCLPAEV